MSQKCFYCTDDKEENEIHLVTFQVSHMDREEILCDECYQEWLQGIKG
jgi:hypothetical protein